MARPRFLADRPVPELMIGLVALAIAVLVGGVATAHAVRDVKKRRDTITVTGSARYPITANQVTWRLIVTSQAASAARASRRLRRQVQAVRSFLTDNGISDQDVTLPPIS